ncbi:alanine--tRNA ligase-related protein, partial [Microgenomates group bacterium]|nr:alanine--tRNA ligase-related protein [Microgenomates group bacterium]
MKMNQTRQKFLNYYQEKKHVIIPSSSLVPENDATTLFTSSGMQPLVPYLMGEKHPEGTRLANSQKCFRSNDIEEVGDNRHTTFFEMLGNWSLGDYGKKEQLEWVWGFFTKEMGIAPEKLYITVFAGDETTGVGRDEEAIKIWQEIFAREGMEARVGERIRTYGAEKNWWSRSGEPEKMPEGEIGGPDSEIFYDFGAELGIHERSKWKDEECHPNCDCGRFIEIGNSVFIEYVKTAKGFEPLAQKNVDYGGGLGRVMMAVEKKQDVFETSAFQLLREEMEKITGRKYEGGAEEEKVGWRVIMDHMPAGGM